MKKILIIDDDGDLREAMKLVLSGTYEIREAGGKEEGLALVKSFRPDLILLDVMMDTDSTGFEMAREIKGGKDSGQIKILMLTSVDHVTNIDFKSEAGDPAWLPVDGYVNKPILPKDLLSMVGRMI